MIRDRGGFPRITVTSTCLPWIAVDHNRELRRW